MIRYFYLLFCFFAWNNFFNIITIYFYHFIQIYEIIIVDVEYCDINIVIVQLIKDINRKIKNNKNIIFIDR
jgi:hypothetical protein